MADPQLEKLSIKELKDLRLKVDKAISQRRTDERSELKESFRRLAEEAGYSLGEVLGIAKVGKGRATGAAKYANPENPAETWSGRGRQPNWLSSRLKAGASLEDFRV